MQNAKVDKLKEVKRSDMIPGDRGAHGTDKEQQRPTSPRPVSRQHSNAPPHVLSGRQLQDASRHMLFAICPPCFRIPALVAGLALVLV